MAIYIVFDVETPNRANDRMSAIGITAIKDPQVKLNTNRRGKTDYDIVVYGTRSLRKQLEDTVAVAIRRYMEEKEIGTRKLSRLTGIPKGTISRYRNGTAKYDPDYLCAIPEAVIL